MLLDHLKTKRLILRLPELSDAAEIYEKLSDPKVNRWLPRVPKPYTLKDSRAWIRQAPDSIANDERYPFAIVERSSELLIGMISLSFINRKDASAELGYWLARSQWGNGYATEAVRAICRWGFSSKQKLHRIYAWVHSENPASYTVLEKVGFRREGTCIKATRITGRWKDDYLYACLKGELR